MSSSSLSNPNELSMTTNTLTVTAATNTNKDDDHDHEHDMVMPGFRFHPTEEELIEFYLRRKVEGKRFNVELITFLDLYRYDPWELPAMAAIGEKEWYFYVPRDRKYRNGDRPNRVTNSGYWKATGADRLIKSDQSSRSIGLKKTLVFYSGKAPKGIRTSWIMNEYRLPHHETERYNKTEISLCRVYKRPGIEDHHRVSSLPPSLPSRGSSSRSTSSTASQSRHKHSHDHNITLDRFIGASSASNLGQNQQRINMEFEKLSTETDGSSSCSDVITTTVLALSSHNRDDSSTSNAYHPIISTSISLPPTIDQDVHDHQSLFLKQVSNSSLVPNDFTPLSSNPLVNFDELHRLVNYQSGYNFNQQQQQQQQQFYTSHQQQQQSAPQFTSLMPQSTQQLALNALPSLPQQPTGLLDRLWEWNNNLGPADASNNKDYSNPFK